LSLCECGCGGEVPIGKRKNRQAVFINGHNRRGKKCTEEHIRKLSINKKNKPLSEEHKKKLSESGKGRSPNSGSFKRGHITWCKNKTFSVVRKGRGLGELNPNWKGGSKLSNARQHHNRRSLGHSFINEPFEDSEGHHLDKDYVLYIPRDLHRSIPHNLTTGKNMDLINVEALKWIINYLKEDTGDE